MRSRRPIALLAPLLRKEIRELGTGSSLWVLLLLLSPLVGYSFIQRSAEVLRFFREANAQPPKRLDQLVGALRLELALAKPVGALSKGYRRRLLLALGLLAPLPVLLMDEPFDGFDLRQTREVMSLLRDEALGGRTLLLSIHQLGDAQRICDRLVLLSAGRVVATGTSAELTASAGLPPGSNLEEVFLALA